MTRQEKIVLVSSVICIVGPKAERGVSEDEQIYETVRSVLDNFDSDWRYKDEKEELQRLYDSVLGLVLERGFDIVDGKVVPLPGVG